MAKANPLTGATVYVAEGADVPDDLPPGVRPVGPGAPKPKAKPKAEAEKAPEPEADPAPPPASAPKAAWVDHAKAAGVPEDEAESMTKAALIEAVQENGQSM